MPVRLSIRASVRPHSMPLRDPAIATLRALLLWARRAWPGNGLWGDKNRDTTDHVAWGPQRSRKLRPIHYPFFLCVMSACLAVRPSVGPSVRPHSMPSCFPHRHFSDANRRSEWSFLWPISGHPAPSPNRHFSDGNRRSKWSFLWPIPGHPAPSPNRHFSDANRCSKWSVLWRTSEHPASSPNRHFPDATRCSKWSFRGPPRRAALALRGPPLHFLWTADIV